MTNTHIHVINLALFSWFGLQHTLMFHLFLILFSLLHFTHYTHLLKFISPLLSSECVWEGGVVCMDVVCVGGGCGMHGCMGGMCVELQT